MGCLIQEATVLVSGAEGLARVCVCHVATEGHFNYSHGSLSCNKLALKCFCFAGVFFGGGGPCNFQQTSQREGHVLTESGKKLLLASGVGKMTKKISLRTIIMIYGFIAPYLRSVQRPSDDFTISVFKLLHTKWLTI